MNRCMVPSEMKASGYAYVEVIIAALLIAVALAPAAEALRTVAHNAAVQRNLLSIQYNVASRMEQVLAAGVMALEAEATSTGGTTASSWSDAATTSPRIVVYLKPYDADNADLDGDTTTGTDAGVVEVVVEAENTGISHSNLAVDLS